MTKYVGLALTLTITIIMVASLLVPIVSDATDHTEKFTQSDIRVSMISSETIGDPISVEVTSLPNWVINGVNYRLIASYTYMFDDETMILRVTSSGTYMPGVSGSVTSASLTIAEGKITGTVNGSPYEYSWVGDLYYPSDKGEYVLTTSPATKYLLPDTECKIIGLSYFDGANRTVYLNGTVQDGFTLKYSQSGAEVEYTSITEPTKIEGYEDLYSIVSIQFVDSSDATVTFDRFVTAASVTATKEHNAGVDNILWVVPIIVLLSLLVMVARNSIYRE